jgi:hypothetical protein
MDLLKKIKDRAPEYDSSYEEMITKFTVVQGGRAGTAVESAAWEQGKHFSTKYEMYMYATLLGLKNNYRCPIRENASKNKFIEIKSWQPTDLAEYVIMGVLSKANIDYIELENKDDKEVEKEILNIKRLMEEYANGGLDKIRAKLEAEPMFFDNNENCFIDLLEVN